MSPRRSVDLDVPPLPHPPEEPLTANVLDFFAPPRLPFDVSPIAVLEMAQRQRKWVTEKAIARHARRRWRPLPESLGRARPGRRE